MDRYEFLKKWVRNRNQINPGISILKNLAKFVLYLPRKKWKKFMLYITRKEHFNAAHKLSRPDWTEEQNTEVFGKCANANWHGHNYVLFVTIKGEVNPETGFVVNLKKLSTIIRTKITDKIDHKNLNMDVDFMKGIMTSTENLAMAIWKQLDATIDELGCKLHCIKLMETENNFVEYFGE